MRARTTATGGALVAALLAVLLLSPAEARSLWGRSLTYLGGLVQPADGDVATYLPFFELVELSTVDLGLEGLSVGTSFWGMVDTIDVRDRYRVMGDLNTLFLSWVAPQQGRLSRLRGLELTGGRQLVALGPTILEQVDGGKVHYLHGSGLEVGIFGGVPTGLRFAYLPWPVDDDRYNYGYQWLVGGRLGYLDLGWLSGGASYVHRRYRDRVADNDLGWDMTASALSFVDLSGMATFSLEALRLKEGRAAVSVRPLRAWIVDLGYHFASPDLWLPRTSIFAVFSEETFQEASLSLRWRATRRLTLDGTYGRRFYGAVQDDEKESANEDPGGANRASVRATLRFMEQGAARLTGEAERVEAPENAANRLRLATTIPLSLLGRTFSIVGDVDLMVLDEPIREMQVSFLASAYLDLPLRSDLHLLAGGGGGVTPLLRSSGSFMVRLTWEIEALTSRGKTTVKRGSLL